ncbi:DEAD/DEAH box helicase [Neptunomonas sp.]|uniref:DEAD/DEAH box helicase n=1 Tax=Neptunomonas TaxID=75687 RepID=UPI0035148C92
MQLKDFPYFASDLINLTSDENLSRLQLNQPVQLIEYDDHWLLQQAGERIAVKCAKVGRPQLAGLIRRNQTRWMLVNVQKNNLQLQYLAPVEINELAIELGVDGLISDDLFTKNEISENSIELACQWLAECFVIDTVLPDSQAEEHWLAISRFSNTSTGNGFQLLGKGWRADVEAEHDGRYLIKRITRHQRRDNGFSLLQGAFSFTDASVVAAMRSATHQAVLDAALRDNGSYLELWKLYNDKEWENALKQAETLKALRFSHADAFEDLRINRWCIWPKSTEAYKEFRARWKSLDIEKSALVDLSSQPPDWAEEQGAESKPGEQKENPRGEIHFKDDHIVFTPSTDRKDAVARFIKKEGERSNGGWLYLSLAGQRTIGKRRLTARQSIESGKRMPQLKWLLEGVSVPSERHRKLKALTPYAKETFKGGKPTEKQLLALEIALNTPDIAIIIGPPGTGKTQVIAALQRRLAEEFEDQKISGQVLVSSFQHDAVDNALDRSQVFNLPGTRVGGKKQSADEEGNFSRWIDAQAVYLQEQIEQQYQQLPMLQQLDDISLTMALLRVTQFSSAQYVDQWQQLLRQLKTLDQSGGRVSARLLSELEDYVEEQQQLVPKSLSFENHASTLRCIRALRVTEASYADDGCVKAGDLLRQLNRQLHRFSGDSKALLRQAADTALPPPGLLQSLNILRNQLLNQYLPDYRPPELKQTLDNRGVNLLDDLEVSLEQHMQQHKHGVAWALQELANSIDTDRQAALKTTEEYAMVVGATCQQAAGNKMASLKSVVGLDSSEIGFDTVIVDEAARANPLDLFIPMSMAERRVILVGDDRQLPHMLEPDIEGQLQDEHQLTEQQLEAFKFSLFERLRLQLEALDDRVVMLDTQFRMHPVLGNFVSQQFYESIGMKKVKSGREAPDFVFQPTFIQSLGNEGEYYDGKVCQWIDVPLAEGRASKRGTSRIREVEAEYVAKEVQRLFMAGGNSLSVGVITFYAAQRDLIMEKLAKTQVDGKPLIIKRDGQFEPSPEFAITAYGEEGLRVGSVDAFQGKEFDVVLLSCVRTWQIPKTHKQYVANDDKSSEDFHEDQLNRMFGFLRLPNRMNVAMSRQRQMLICIGDAELATNEYAKEGVPALNAFYKMCGGEHGAIR